MLYETLSLLTLLFVFAIFVGAVDTMAGGGGLLAVPGLMAAGLDPISALATNKLQAIFGTSSAVIQFWRKGRVRLIVHILPAIAAFLAAIAGASAVTRINTAVLQKAVPFLLILIALILLARPSLGTVPRRRFLPRFLGMLTLVSLIGFYDGFFGPGTGTFYAFGGVAILGADLEDATIRAKIYNFASNCGGLYYLSAGGHTSWAYGAAMAAGTFIGGMIGARLILRHGVRLIKPFVVAMSLAMSLHLLWQQGIIQEISKLIDAGCAEGQCSGPSDINIPL